MINLDARRSSCSMVGRKYLLGVEFHVSFVTGGIKASRKICGPCKSGVKEFKHTNIKITTGMTN